MGPLPLVNACQGGATIRIAPLCEARAGVPAPAYEGGADLSPAQPRRPDLMTREGAAGLAPAPLWRLDRMPGQGGAGVPATQPVRPHGRAIVDAALPPPRHQGGVVDRIQEGTVPPPPLPRKRWLRRCLGLEGRRLRGGECERQQARYDPRNAGRRSTFTKSDVAPDWVLIVSVLGFSTKRRGDAV